MVSFVHFSMAKRLLCLNKEPGVLSPLLRHCFADKCMDACYIWVFLSVYCAWILILVCLSIVVTHIRCVPTCCISFLFALLSCSFSAKLSWESKFKVGLTGNALLSGLVCVVQSELFTENISPLLHAVQSQAWACSPAHQLSQCLSGSLLESYTMSRFGKVHSDSSEVLCRHFRELGYCYFLTYAV